MAVQGPLALEVLSRTVQQFVPRPSGECLVNEAELIAPRMGLLDTAGLGFHSFIKEGDSLCVNFGGWGLVYILGSRKDLELATKLNISFIRVLHSANEVADSLEGGYREAGSSCAFVSLFILGCLGF